MHGLAWRANHAAIYPSSRPRRRNLAWLGSKTTGRQTWPISHNMCRSHFDQCVLSKPPGAPDTPSWARRGVQRGVQSLPYCAPAPTVGKRKPHPRSETQSLVLERASSPSTSRRILAYWNLHPRCTRSLFTAVSASCTPRVQIPVRQDPPGVARTGRPLQHQRLGSRSVDDELLC